MIDSPRLATALVCVAFAMVGIAGFGILAPERGTLRPIERTARQAPATLTPAEVPWSTISSRLQLGH